jgi:hypothetical protein
MGRIPVTGFQLVAQETFTTGVLKPVLRPGLLRPRPGTPAPGMPQAPSQVGRGLRKRSGQCLTLRRPLTRR